MSLRAPHAAEPDAILELVPVIRRVVAARVSDRHSVDDIVQETVSRVMAVADRLDDGALTPYAVVTAQNLVSDSWRRADVARRNAHRMADLQEPVNPEDPVLAYEERHAIANALTQLPDADREAVVAHEIAGQDTVSMAAERGSTPGAVAAHLNRARARLRVEYLIALEHLSDLPTEQCRPVLLALSGGDRRRQREVHAARHLMECSLCAALSVPLVERLSADPEGDVCLAIAGDADIVIARQRAREAAETIGFDATDRTLIATAVSEITRNIVRFAGRGDVTLTQLNELGRSGLRVIAHDTGPGIPDVAAALRDGYSTYGGMGLGLPGARRIMDQFSVTSESGVGTTVTMTKWRP